MRRDPSKRQVRCSAAAAAILFALAASPEARAQDASARPAAPAQPLDVRDARVRYLGLGEPDIVIDGAELRSYGTSFYEVEEPLALRAGIGFHATGDTASEDWVLIRGWPRDSSRKPWRREPRTAKAPP